MSFEKVGNYLLPMTLFCLAACGRAPRPNVLIVTFDTTRADHLACYGNENVRTPAVDQLAREGVLFERAFSSAPITCPAHATIMTGKAPFVHGVRDNGLFVLGKNQKTLAEILKSYGYRTAAAIGSFPLIAKFGLDQGFDFYDDRLTPQFEDSLGHRTARKSNLFFDERKAARVNEAVLPWLEENHREPFFLWVHYFDPHHPHEPPPPYRQLYSSNLYLGEIAYADECLGNLIGHLKNLGVYDKTLVVFTADHGEGLGEHHESTHSLLVYNSTLHVPLIIKTPDGSRNRRVGTRVGTVDIMPTVLELLDIPRADDLQGRSLNPFLKPGNEAETAPAPGPLYAETLSPRLGLNLGELRAIFSGNFKYTYGPIKELYDLDEDPGELRNLVSERPQIAQKLKVELAHYLEKHAVDDPAAAVEMDAETMERLMALGYVHFEGHQPGVILEELRDDGQPPQEVVADNGAFSQAKQFLYNNQALDAKIILQNLLERNPNNPIYLDLLAQAELNLSRFDEAMRIMLQLRELESPVPPRDRVLAQIAHIHFSRGQYDQALAKLQESLLVRDTALGRYRIAKVFQEMDRDGEALEHLEQSLSLDPNYVPARLDLGVALAQRGDPQAARAHFQKALKDHPYYPKSFYNYGTFLIQTGQPETALTYFKRAVELNPNYPKALHALVVMYAQLDQKEEAERYWTKLTDLAPNHELVELGQQILESKWPP